jgi:hypothetical protein
MTKRSSLQNPNPTKRHFEETPSLSENVSPGQTACDVSGNVAIESPPASAAVVAVATSTSLSENVSPGQTACDVSGNVAIESPPVSAAVVAVATSTSSSPTTSVPPSPGSPGNNRAAFLSKLVPSRALCNLDLCRSPPGSKVALSAVVIAVFDASTNPDRRYIQVADATGSLGVTVWNANVSKLSRQSVGQVMKVGKAVIGSHQGKKVLTLSRESTLEFDAEHPLRQWWNELLQQPSVSIAATLDVADNSIINISGILGMVVSEDKMVGTVLKTLVTLHLVDQTGTLDVRTWNHPASFFDAYVEQPILISRVRMTSYAGLKIGELLANDASLIQTEFSGKKALQQYWVN